MAITVDTQVLGELAADAQGEPGGSIWRDPHVQRELLATHLDQSTTAATRSAEAVARTVGLLADGLGPGASVLDLGCGPGIYCRALASRGLDVTGIDMNAASIEYARSLGGPGIVYVEADYTRRMPAGPFDLVLLVYLDFGTHPPDTQRRLLREVSARLRPGGRLVVDVLDATAAARHAAGRDWEASASGGFWSAAPYLLLSETTVRPEVLAQRIRYTLLTGSQVRRFDVWEHCFAESSIRAMLADAGFAEVVVHRDVLAGCDPQADDVVFVTATR